MHVQPPRRFRDVVVAELEHPLDVLPSDPVGGHRIVRRRRRLARLGQQGADHIVGVGGFGQVVACPGLNRRHGGGDVAVAGQHDHPGVGANLVDRLDDPEAVAVFQPHVQHREGRGTRLHRRKRF